MTYVEVALYSNMKVWNLANDRIRMSTLKREKS